ncbi:hypothetical protein OAU89_01060 [bacterium]|nr:hypothetical protein [bacterium]
MAHYTNDSSSLVKLISNRINVTYEDNNGNLWIGTAQGMQKLDIQKETIQTFSIKNGMPNNFINGLLSEGDTALWMSTDVGISRMSIANESFINFYKQNGLTTNEFNRISFYQTQDGRLYFGSIKGVNAFYPNNLSLKEKKNNRSKFDSYFLFKIGWS